MRFPFSRLPRASLDHPLGVLVLLSLITLAFAGQIPELKTEFGYRPLLGEEHPSIQVLDGFIERFGGGFPVQIVWSCSEVPHCQTIFDPASLRMADAVSRRLASLAHEGVTQLSLIQQNQQSVHHPAAAGLVAVGDHQNGLAQSSRPRRLSFSHLPVEPCGRTRDNPQTATMVARRVKS